MFTKKDWSTLVLCLPLLVGAASSACAEGATQIARQSLKQGAQLREGQNTLAPFAFIRFCVTAPDACRPTAMKTIAWSAETKRLVDDVNRSVNRRIRPTNESGDTWNADVTKGDCEDFALTKRHALIKAGLPASALRMAVARTADGEGHAVLVVRTQEADIVLDNRTSQLLPWNKTGLTWLKIASGTDPRLWRRII